MASFTEFDPTTFAFKQIPGNGLKCQFCDASLDYFLAPDYRNPGEFFKIPNPCGCDGAQSALRAECERKISDDVARKNAERDESSKTYNLATCGVGERYRGAVLEGDFAEYVAGFKTKFVGRGMWLSGNYDAGKTHNACAVVLALVELGYTAQIVPSPDLVDAIRLSFGSMQHEREVAERFINSDLLVIDDLGKENPTSWAAEQLWTIINTRYSAQRSIIVTTNYSGQEIVSKWAEKTGDEKTAKAIISRLQSTCIPVTVTRGAK